MLFRLFRVEIIQPKSLCDSPLRGIGERYALISSVLCNPASLCRMAGFGKYLICNELLITPG